MALLETLDKIEAMVAGARTLPFTERILINDNDLVHYVEELRKDLPREMKRADEIVENEQKIIKDAQAEADRILRNAKEYAAQLTDEHAIMKEAKEKARTLMEETQQQQRDIMSRTQDSATKMQSDVDAYANQVFDQLIRHVTSTFQGVQQAESGLKQALSVLEQARSQMNAARAPHPAKGSAPAPVNKNTDLAKV